MIIGIYKITSPIGKIYIGQTKNFIQRLNNYKNPNKNCIGRKLYNSIKKYGWNNHNIEIIHKIENIDNLQEILDNLEIYYIEFFNSVKEGLNLTYGGNGGKPSEETINKRIKTRTSKIIQCDLEGNFVKEWNNLSEIENILGFKKETIRMNINGKTKYSKGYKWLYKNKPEKKFVSKVKKINQYDLKGNFIRTWDSANEAKAWLGKGDIRGCLLNRQKKAGKYIWKYVEI